MPRFCALASGSSGNSAFIDANGTGLLIDFGIGPRMIGSRLAAVGASWGGVNAAILTHVHGDHWCERTLAEFCTRRIPLYCHPIHRDMLLSFSPAAEPLKKAGLLRDFSARQPLELPNGMTCLPIPVPHDSDPTFAFRIDGTAGLFHDVWSIGYASDLGTTPLELVQLFRDVELLAIEFNHDVEMEKRSGRPLPLIERVLGDLGHLSNVQAADTLRAIIKAGTGDQLKQVVQLHLSYHCNRPDLALLAARQVARVMKKKFEVHTAAQNRTTRLIDIAA